MGDFCLLLYPFLYHPFQAGGAHPQSAQAGARFVLPLPLAGYEITIAKTYCIFTLWPDTVLGTFPYSDLISTTIL